MCNSQHGQEIVFSKTSRLAQRPTQPLNQWATFVLSMVVKHVWHETDHPYPSSVTVKNEWMYTSTPHAPSEHAKERFKLSHMQTKKQGPF
jgi:hypothetical protein